MNLLGWMIGCAAAIAIFGIGWDRMPKARMWSLLFLGAVTAGAMGAIDARIANTVAHTGNSITNALIGVPCALVLVAVLFLLIFWDRAKKDGEDGTRFFHSVVAFITPEILIAAGGIFASAVGLGTSLLANMPATLAF